jgi:hypothetical protein
MSAYQLADEQFQTISNWLYEQAQNRDAFSCRYDVYDFLELKQSFDIDDEAIRNAIKTCVRNYYNLNRLALVTRYGEKYDKDDTKSFSPSFMYQTIDIGNIIDLLKSLRYQCAEYITSDTMIFKALGDFIGKLCCHAYRNMRESQSSRKYLSDKENY